MSAREMWLLIAVLGLGGLFLADRFVLAPILEALDASEDEISRLEAELTEAQALIDSRRAIEARWAGYQLAGLDRDLERARLHVQEQLAIWSRDTGVNLESLSTGRVLDREAFQALTFNASGVGTMTQVQQFLYRLRRADFPLRVLTCDITSRGTDADRLNLSLTLSTLVTTEPAGAPARQAVASGGAS